MAHTRPNLREIEEPSLRALLEKASALVGHGVAVSANSVRSLQRFTSHTGEVTALAVLPDGRALSGSFDWGRFAGIAATASATALSLSRVTAWTRRCTDRRSRPSPKLVPSRHKRCRMTASLRASATFALVAPLRLAKRMPHAVNATWGTVDPTAISEGAPENLRSRPQLENRVAQPGPFHGGFA